MDVKVDRIYGQDHLCYEEVLHTFPFATAFAREPEISSHEDWYTKMVYDKIQMWFLAAQRQEVTITLPRPRFLDWLLKRKKTHVVNVYDVVDPAPKLLNKRIHRVVVPIGGW